MRSPLGRSPSVPSVASDRFLREPQALNRCFVRKLASDSVSDRTDGKTDHQTRKEPGVLWPGVVGEAEQNATSSLGSPKRGRLGADLVDRLPGGTTYAGR